MTQKHTDPYFSSDDDKRKHINALIGFFSEERDEEIGYIAAEQILDFFLNETGKDIYRKGVEDARKLVVASHEDLMVELDIITPASGEK